MSKILVELKQSLASMHKSPDIHAAGIAYSIYIPRAIENIEQLESENARLRKAIEESNHECDCEALRWDEEGPFIFDDMACTCWKSKALGEQE